MDYPAEIAKEGLGINAIKLSTNPPFTWASGFNMPIYDDNRMFLANPNHRKMIARGFREMIRSQGIPYDMIAGTSTAGIAPAASLADLLNTDLVIFEENKPYVYHSSTDDIEGEFDAIASTCPWAIPTGVAIANQKDLPFMYVRQSQKAHGLKQQIEGIPIEGQNVLLVNYHRGDSYKDNATRALAEKGVTVRQTLTKNLSDIEPFDIKGKTIPIIEDLISTGGSSAGAVQLSRNNGAISNCCLSIFTYGLDKATEAFATLDPACQVRSLLTYDRLLSVARETGYIDDKQTAMLSEWRANPFNWGEKHGFPKVEK